jgi:hypothetical protein
VTAQLDLFQEAKVEIEKPEPMTEVRLGHRSARVPLRKQRKEALARLMDILVDLGPSSTVKRVFGGNLRSKLLVWRAYVVPNI